jgi:hypothetical protein
MGLRQYLPRGIDIPVNRLRIYPKVVLAPADGTVDVPEGAHGRGVFEFVQIYLPITFIKETFSRYDAAKMLVCSYNENL